MSSTHTAQQAIELLEQQLTELAGIRNATPRDPSFKNWRQGTLTVMQRIWPGDQERSERFRRIPFSPADPRSDARAIREWYSRGCQEATRVLNGFVEDIRKSGVPDVPEDVASKPSSGEFEVDFPTVDLPSGDLGTSPLPADEPDNMFADLMVEPPVPSLPRTAPPPALQAKASPAGAPMAEAPIVSTPDSRQVRKGLNMKAKLRDLLGFAQLSAKAIAGHPRELAPAPAPSEVRPPRPAPPKLNMVPVGDEEGIDRPADARPTPALEVPTVTASDPAPDSVRQGPPPLPISPLSAPTPAAPAAEADALDPEPGKSVVMSRPTTLRASIEKVSIESLISPKFRNPDDEETAPEEQAAPYVAPVEPPAPIEAAAPIEPPARIEIASPIEIAPPIEIASPIESVTSPKSFSKVLPMPPRATSGRPAMEPLEEEDPIAEIVDPEAFAQATEDFMRSSPVLGAKGRRVKRGYDEPASEGAGFEDADAIAVASMVEDLGPLGVPVARQAETRARLLDLARRLESGELDWATLRKAVWFAMEYPEVARRLMPVLLPWIDRAA